MNFSAKYLKILNSKEISVEKVKSQLLSFQNGFPPLAVSRAAVVGDGITSISIEEINQYAHRWDNSLKSQNLIVAKFVPASGAATRMFKEYFDYVESGKTTAGVRKTLQNINKFAFADDLKELGVKLTDKKATIDAIVAEAGLNYGQMPKALIKFHNYKDGGRTACEEHLVEGALYGMSSDGTVKVHFTVSPEHLEAFQNLIAQHQQRYEQRYGVTYSISYSQQKSSTDTIAVDLDNKPFITEKKDLLFRPAGHGALIENLSDIDADIVFIKTVDNVVPDHKRADTIRYKKALAQIAIELKSQIFCYLNDIDNNRIDVVAAKNFVEENFGYKFAEVGDAVNAERLREVLNRPIRVCGMVVNEGEPGGGPYWVQDEDGESVQIAESSQIAADKKALMRKSTHFNPVDLVCITKDYKGNKFNLGEFVDPDTGFISTKSYQGRELKALELPGLWNGAMSRWNTLFVEVPITTFAPVKTLEDLLRDQHQ